MKTFKTFKEHIVKTGSGYKLVSKKTGKNLGTAITKAGIEKRERQVQYFKHMHEEVEENLDIKKELQELSAKLAKISRQIND